MFIHFEFLIFNFKYLEFNFFLKKVLIWVYFYIKFKIQINFYEINTLFYRLIFFFVFNLISYFMFQQFFLTFQIFCLNFILFHSNKFHFFSLILISFLNYFFKYFFIPKFNYFFIKIFILYYFQVIHVFLLNFKAFIYKNKHHFKHFLSFCNFLPHFRYFIHIWSIPDFLFQIIICFCWFNLFFISFLLLIILFLKFSLVNRLQFYNPKVVLIPLYKDYLI